MKFIIDAILKQINKGEQLLSDENFFGFDEIVATAKEHEYPLFSIKLNDGSIIFAATDIPCSNEKIEYFEIHDVLVNGRYKKCITFCKKNVSTIIKEV